MLLSYANNSSQLEFCLFFVFNYVIWRDVLPTVIFHFVNNFLL